MIEFNVSFSMYLSNINNYNHQQCLRTEPNYIWEICRMAHIQI